MNNLQCTMNVQNEMKVQLAFVDGRPHVEFCGTSREGASEADISELFDKAKGAAIAALRSLDGDGGNGAVSDDAGGDPFRRSVMRKFTRLE